MLYVALAVEEGPHRLGVIRASIPLARMEAQLTDIRLEFLAAGGILALLALAVTLLISRQYGRKIDELKEGAARLARGELGHRLPLPRSEELGGLALSLNRMAAELEARLETVVRQRNELEAVLSSMMEGVIAVDRGERILSLNPAAARWFDLDAERVRGKTVPEAIRNLAIQQFIARALETPAVREEDITVHRGTERILNIRSTPLRGAGTEAVGVLIVFSDVTRLRRLEEVRRDFVANVSHEIKTPLTAIQGFVETLAQHGIEDAGEASRFLQIIARHVERLNAIVEDLLLLSRIENEGERGELRRERRAPSSTAWRGCWRAPTRSAVPGRRRKGSRSRWKRIPPCGSPPTPCFSSRPWSISWTTPSSTAIPASPSPCAAGKRAAWR